MTAAAIDQLAIAPPLPPKRVQWRRAGAIVRALVADPERTELVFELMDSVGGSGHERCFQRFAAHPEGQRLFEERPSLVAAMADRAALAALPEDSFGRAYHDFATQRDLAADGLVELNKGHDAAVREVVDPHRRFYFDRVTAMHDLWHVLTGYGTDEAGEASLLSFSMAQIPSRGIGVLVATSAVVFPKDWLLTSHRYLLAAYLRGQRATRLDLIRYEEMLPLPLERVRRRLGIALPGEAHPRGILVGGPNRATEWVTG